MLGVMQAWQNLGYLYVWVHIHTYRQTDRHRQTEICIGVHICVHILAYAYAHAYTYAEHIHMPQPPGRTRAALRLGLLAGFARIKVSCIRLQGQTQGSFGLVMDLWRCYVA